jgi:hypothetical protein
MFTLIRTALRSFLLGLVVGMLVAPRSGADTRRLLVEKLEAFVNGVLDVAGLPPVDIEDGSPWEEHRSPREEEGAGEGPTPMRSRRAGDMGAATSG